MISLLLLDLDGVVIIEAGRPHVAHLEIFLLHRPLRQALCDIGVPVVALTHRSRAQARQILQLAGLSDGGLAGLLAAEDILKAALRSDQRWLLLRDGLKKSWILPEVERRYGIERRHIAFIDDGYHNLEDMAGSGIGLAILAPSGISVDGSSLVSFDLQELAQLVTDWDETEGPRIHTLTAQENRIQEWCRTGVGTKQGLRLFSEVRRHGRTIRRLIGTA